jgi:hypothetical protein
MLSFLITTTLSFAAIKGISAEPGLCVRRSVSNSN